MDPVRKAIWFAESHSRDAISLEEIAGVCEVSAFHLTRAFAAVTGVSLMRYVRARRLSEAARALADGAGDILSVALDAGYHSHEAFTRAFRDQFGLTPEQLRAQGDCTNLCLMEALSMNTPATTRLEAPRFETVQPMTIAGISERYDCDNVAGIPDLWQRFGSFLGNIPGQTEPYAYGVCYGLDDDNHMDYMCGVEVSGTEGLPAELSTMTVPAGAYVVFKHKEHVAGIRNTISAIWSNWFPESGRTARNAPMLERYGPEFDARTGLGGFEIWIAIE